MLDLVLVATMVLVCGGIGLPLAKLLPSRFAWRLAIAPVLGYAVLAVAVPVAYRAGATIAQFFYASAGLAALSLALHARGVIRATKATASTERRLALAAIVVSTLALLVMLAPRWVGGDQFSVFQGNHWDTFGYLESAIVYARNPYTIVHAATTDLEIVRNPLVSVAVGQLGERPSVHQLYAVFSRVAPDQMYRLYYPFLVFSFLQFIQVALFVLRNTFPKMPPRAWFAIALVFPLGFWGQYVLDINAWSQISSIPVLFLMFGLVLDTSSQARTELRPALRVAAVLGIVVAGGIYLYPEGFLVFSAALFPLASAIALYRIVRMRTLIPALPLLGVLGVVTVVLYGPQLDFLLAQVRWSSGTPVTWWKFFQAFFWGRDRIVGGSAPSAVDFSAGLFGLYFVTPLGSTGAVMSVVRRIAIVGTLGGLLGAVGTQLRSQRAAEVRAPLAMWTAVAVLLLAPAAWFAHKANYWPAGKVVSYGAPVFVTLLCLPIGLTFTGRFRMLRWIATAFVAFQLALGVTRIVAAHRRDGIHYVAPYPGVQAPELKQNMPWDLRPLESVLTRETHVLVRPMDPFLQAYVMMFCFARHVPYAVDGEVNTYFGQGRKLAGLPPPWTPDVEISRDGPAFVLQYRDGSVLRLQTDR